VNTALVVSLGLLAAALLLPALHTRAGALAALAGSLLLVVLGLIAAGSWGSASVALGSWLGFGDANLRVGGLQGIFLALTGVSGAAVSTSTA
jgi:formate hydrogenlyase subunit 3/multisubunit Na+/H+ antiporter MnhD subunit